MHILYAKSINDGFGWGNMLKNLTFWAEIDEIDGFLVIFYSSKILVQGLTTNGHHKSFFCYLFYVAIYMRYLKSVVRPLVLFFWEVCVSGLQWCRNIWTLDLKFFRYISTTIRFKPSSDQEIESMGPAATCFII